MAEAKPVPIRGMLFPSQNAAAAHFGITRAAVCLAAKRGTLDYVGLGRRRPSRPKRGIPYGEHESIAAAERANGLKRGTLYQRYRRALERGE